MWLFGGSSYSGSDSEGSSSSAESGGASGTASSASLTDDEEKRRLDYRRKKAEKPPKLVLEAPAAKRPLPAAAAPDVPFIGAGSSEIPAWDPATELLRPGAFDTMLVVAGRQEGKSTLIRVLIERVVNPAPPGTGFDVIYAFSNSEATLHSYAKCIPVIRNKKTGQALNLVHWKTQGDAVLRRLRGAQAKLGAKAPRVLLILDDVLGKSLRSSEDLQQLFTQGRHERLAVWLLAQAWTSAIPPVIRKNADLIVALRLRSGVEAKSFGDEVIRGSIGPGDVGAVEVGGEAPRSESGLIRAVLSHYTQRYGALVVDHRRRASGLLLSLRHYRVDPGLACGDE